VATARPLLLHYPVCLIKVRQPDTCFRNRPFEGYGTPNGTVCRFENGSIFCGYTWALPLSPAGGSEVLDFSHRNSVIQFFGGCYVTCARALHYCPRGVTVPFPGCYSTFPGVLQYLSRGVTVPFPGCYSTFPGVLQYLSGGVTVPVPGCYSTFPGVLQYLSRGVTVPFPGCCAQREAGVFHAGFHSSPSPNPNARSPTTQIFSGVFCYI
jgi:hypothetical protein